MRKYLVVLEETGTGYSAYSPDLPGFLFAGLFFVGFFFRGLLVHGPFLSAAQAGRVIARQFRRERPLFPAVTVGATQGDGYVRR